MKTKPFDLEKISAEKEKLADDEGSAEKRIQLARECEKSYRELARTKQYELAFKAIFQAIDIVSPVLENEESILFDMAFDVCCSLSKETSRFYQRHCYERWMNKFYEDLEKLEMLSETLASKKNDNYSAKKIQAHIRGFLTRKKSVRENLQKEKAQAAMQNFFTHVDSIHQKLNADNLEKNKASQDADALYKQNREAYVERVSNTMASLDPDARGKNTAGIAAFQKSWRALTREDSLIALNPQGFYSNATANFVNKQKDLQYNLNLDKQRELLTAWRKQDWQHPIFSDPLYEETVLALFALEKIKDFEFQSLLIIQYLQTPMPFSAEKYTRYPFKGYTVLNEDGEFSEAFKKLLPRLENFIRMPFKWAHYQSKFKALAQAVFKDYPAENTFFIVEDNEVDEVWLKERHVIHHRVIRYENENPGSPWKFQEIVFPCLVRNIFELTFIDVKNIVPVFPWAGPLLPADIERGCDAGLRAAAYCSKKVLGTEDVHDYDLSKMSDMTKLEHDYQHASIMTYMTEVNRQAFLRMKYLSRLFLKHCKLDGSKPLLSKPTWALIDADFHYFYLFGYLIQESPVAAFCEAFDFCRNEKGHKDRSLFFDPESGIPRDLGILTFIDMLQYGTIWKAFGFDPEYLKGDYKSCFKTIKKLSPFFIKDESLEGIKHNLLVFRLYSMLGLDYLKAFMLLIEVPEIKTKLFQSVECKRNNLKDFLGLVNPALQENQYIENETGLCLTILLALGHKPEITQKTTNEDLKGMKDLLKTHLVPSGIPSNEKRSSKRYDSPSYRRTPDR